MVLGLGVDERCLGVGELTLGLGLGALGCLQRGHGRFLRVVQLVKIGPPLARRGLQRRLSVGQLGQTVAESGGLGLVPLDGGPKGTQLASHLGGLSARYGHAVAPFRLEVGPVRCQPPLGLGQTGVLGRQRTGFVFDGVEIPPAARGLGLETGDDRAVGESRPLPLDPPAPLGDDRGQSSGPLPQGLEADEGIAQVVGTVIGQVALVGPHVGIQLVEGATGGVLLTGPVAAYLADGMEGHAQVVDLASGVVDAQGRQFGHEIAVTARRFGLLLEGPELAPDLAHQVPHPRQLAIGGGEPTLRSLLALPELEDARRLLDYRPAILGPGIENGVDLAL